MKACEVCHQSKPLPHFYVDPLSPDGYAAGCRSCVRAATRDREDATSKRCSRCGEIKPVGEFHRNKARGDGVSPYCAVCTRRYANTYYAEKSHDSMVSKVYHLSRGAYAVMSKAQNGVCAICARPEFARLNGTVKRLAVDHDHKTGAVRALLCSRCNTILGRADDDVHLLRAAIAYIERHAE